MQAKRETPGLRSGLFGRLVGGSADTPQDKKVAGGRVLDPPAMKWDALAEPKLPLDPQTAKAVTEKP